MQFLNEMFPPCKYELLWLFNAELSALKADIHEQQKWTQ